MIPNTIYWCKYVHQYFQLFKKLLMTIDANTNEPNFYKHH